MIVDCVIKMIKDLNQIPAENRIYYTTSPNTLITGRARLDYLQVNKLNFGDYV